MEKNFQCPLCMHNYSSLQRLESHLKRRISCRKQELDKLPIKIKIGQKDLKLKPDVLPCPYCRKEF